MWSARGYGVMYQGKKNDMLIRCPCGRYLLTDRQLKKKQLCTQCQKELHAKEFHKKYDLPKEE